MNLKREPWGVWSYRLHTVWQVFKIGEAPLKLFRNLNNYWKSVKFNNLNIRTASRVNKYNCICCAFHKLKSSNAFQTQMVFQHHAYLKANIIDTIYSWSQGHQANPPTPLQRQQSNLASLNLLKQRFSVKTQNVGKKVTFFLLCTSENKHNPLNVFLIPVQCYFF